MFTIDKKWEFKCPSTNGQMMWLQGGEFSNKNTNAKPQHGSTLKMMLSERNQSPKTTYSKTPSVVNVGNRQI